MAAGSAGEVCSAVAVSDQLAVERSIVVEGQNGGPRVRAAVSVVNVNPPNRGLPVGADEGWLKAMLQDSAVELNERQLANLLSRNVFAIRAKLAVLLPGADTHCVSLIGCVTKAVGVNALKPCSNMRYRLPHIETVHLNTDFHREGRVPLVFTFVSQRTDDTASNKGKLPGSVLSGSTRHSLPAAPFEVFSVEEIRDRNSRHPVVQTACGDFLASQERLELLRAEAKAVQTLVSALVTAAYAGKEHSQSKSDIIGCNQETSKNMASIWSDPAKFAKLVAGTPELLHVPPLAARYSAGSGARGDRHGGGVRDTRWARPAESSSSAHPDQGPPCMAGSLRMLTSGPPAEPAEVASSSPSGGASRAKGPREGTQQEEEQELRFVDDATGRQGVWYPAGNGKWGRQLGTEIGLRVRNLRR